MCEVCGFWRACPPGLVPRIVYKVTSPSCLVHCTFARSLGEPRGSWERIRGQTPYENHGSRATEFLSPRRKVCRCCISGVLSGDERTHACILQNASSLQPVTPNFAEPPAGDASGFPRQTQDSRRDVVVGGPRSLLVVPLVGRIYEVIVVHARYARVRALHAALISADPGMMVFHKRTSCWFPWQSAIFRKARTYCGNSCPWVLPYYYGS